VGLVPLEFSLSPRRTTHTVCAGLVLLCGCAGDDTQGGLDSATSDDMTATSPEGALPAEAGSEGTDAAIDASVGDLDSATSDDMTATSLEAALPADAGSDRADASVDGSGETMSDASGADGSFDAADGGAGTTDADAAPIDAADADASTPCIQTPRQAPLDLGDSPVGLRTTPVFIANNGFSNELSSSSDGVFTAARTATDTGWYISFDPYLIGPASLTLQFFSYSYTLCSPSTFVVSGTGTPPIPCGADAGICSSLSAQCLNVGDAGPVCVSP
jgi:hypothetical protein